MRADVQQLVHGYEHGHSLLAASIELERSDSDLVGRLSDLSGTLGPDLEICSYLSVYPLPSRRFFAVAKTWPDNSAPRSGCVLTHTLLIPTNIWATDEEPSRFALFFRKPERDDLDRFRLSLAPNLKAPEQVEVNEPLGELFIQKYFGEGLVPLAWFNASTPDQTSWMIIKSLWPAVRAQFSCCTFALQPRTLDDRPFDLVFAPKAVFARFGDFSRAHIIDHTVNNKDNLSEPWLHSWAKCVFQNSICDECSRIRALSKNLDSHSTSVRAAMFFLELQRRAEESPTAAIGALDLLDRLQPDAIQVSRERSSLASVALRCIQALPPMEAQEMLFLLSERLEQSASEISEDIPSQIREFAQQSVEKEPKQGLALANSLLMRLSKAAPTAFVLGTADAMVRLLRSERIEPTILIDTPELMEQIIARQPELVAEVLRKATSGNRDRLVTSIVEWCRVELTVGVRPALRRALLPEIARGGDSPLVEELLLDVQAHEISEICDVVEKNNAFRPDTLSDLLARLVGERFALEVTQWAKSKPWRSYQAASVVSAACPLSLEGMRALLDEWKFSSWNGSILFAAFLRRVVAISPPRWLLDSFERDENCWAVLLPAINEPITADVAIRLINAGLKRSPISRLSEAPRLLGVPRKAGFEVVREYAIRQFLADSMEGHEQIRIRSWFSEQWVMATLGSIRGDFLSSIVTELCKENTGNWERAWILIRTIPNEVVLINERMVASAVSALLQANDKCWTDNSVKCWRQLLSQVSRGDATRISLCAQALHFALDHSSYPLAPVVAEAFYPVHTTAMEDQENRSPWWFWGFGTWDKAKDLRRSLVDCFLQSHWPPSHFVIAAREPWLLKKLCKRMLRQWKGQEFLETALSELRKQQDSETQALSSALQNLLRFPETLEDEWD